MAPGAPTLTRTAPARSRSELLQAWGPHALLLAALAFLGWCTLTAIAKPGVQYDEVLFVNAALGGDYVGGGFVAERFHGIPTMVMPYSGALKSWLYAPVFELLGVSVTTIRAPAIAMLAATIVLAYAVARPLFGAWPAALLALLMATDPAFMTMAKADWGPVALAALLRVGALAAYVGWARTASARYLWLLAAAVVLGVFNKLDYLAFAAALALAIVVVDHRGVLARLRARPRAAAVPLAALGAALAFEYVKIVRPARDFPVARSDADLAGRVREVWAMLHTTMDGTAIYPYMTTQQLGQRTAITLIGLAAVALASALALWRLGRLRRPPAATWAPFAQAVGASVFVLVLLLATFAALVATPEAIGPHHSMLLWPLPALLAVSLLAAAARMPAGRLRAGAVVVIAGGLVWLAASQVRVAESYRSGFASDRAWAPGWTTEIYAVVDAVRRAAPGVDRVVTADWGLGNQLLALGDEPLRRRLDDSWGTFVGGDPAAIDQLAAASFRGHRSILVLHRPGGELFPGTHAQAQAMLRRLDPRRVDVLYRGRVELAYVVDDRPSTR